MCNLYSLTKNQRTMIERARVMRDLTGNLEATLNIDPDYPTPIIRHGDDGVCEMVMVRWEIPAGINDKCKWATKFEMRSPRDTTRWEEMPTVAT